MTCTECGKTTTVRIDGRCPGCHRPNACDSCPGTYEGRPTPDRMDRRVCNLCGKKVSK